MFRRIQTLWPSPVLIFFAFLLFAGYLAHFGYGVSADEPTMLKYGIDTYAYLFHGGPAPTIIDWEFHNPIVQVVMVVAQNIQGSDLGTDIWFLRHWLNFLMFFGTVLIFYRIITRLSGDWILPLIGCVMLVLSPRVFAHSFYNPKDIPALLFFTAGILTLLRYRESPTIPRLVVHALICAILISLRSFGLILGLFTLWSIGTLAMKGHTKKAGIDVTVYIALTLLFLIAVWPRLWTNPIGNLMTAFLSDTGRMGGTLYMGEMTTSTPWHYVLVWIFITTPLLYSALFLIGNVAFLRDFVRWPMRMLKEFPDPLLFFLWFWVPVDLVFWTGAGIFNEWRHLLFVYPGFILISLFGIQAVFQWIFSLRPLMQKKAMWVAILIGAGSVLWTAGWMTRNHPLQFAYFSVPSWWVKGNFEMDYWGLSYRKGLEYVFATDDRPQVNMYPAERIAIGSALTLPLDDWQRLNFTGPEEADYILDAFITNNYKLRYLPEKELYSVKVDGLTLLTVYEGPDIEGVYEALPE